VLYSSSVTCSPQWTATCSGVGDHALNSRTMPRDSAGRRSKRRTSEPTGRSHCLAGAIYLILVHTSESLSLAMVLTTILTTMGLSTEIHPCANPLILRKTGRLRTSVDTLPMSGGQKVREIRSRQPDSVSLSEAGSSGALEAPGAPHAQAAEDADDGSVGFKIIGWGRFSTLTSPGP
jgi:hypothetical protein